MAAMGARSTTLRKVAGGHGDRVANKATIVTNASPGREGGARWSKGQWLSEFEARFDVSVVRHETSSNGEVTRKLLIGPKEVSLAGSVKGDPKNWLMGLGLGITVAASCLAAPTDDSEAQDVLM